MKLLDEILSYVAQTPNYTEKKIHSGISPADFSMNFLMSKKRVCYTRDLRVDRLRIHTSSHSLTRDEIVHSSSYGSRESRWRLNTRTRSQVARVR